MYGGGLVKKRESPDFRSPEVGISAREFCFFSRESYFTKAIENFFPVFAYPDINTRGVGRSLNSHVNQRWTVLNSPNPSRVYIRLYKHAKRFLLLKSSLQIFCHAKILIPSFHGLCYEHLAPRSPFWGPHMIKKRKKKEHLHFLSLASKAS